MKRTGEQSKVNTKINLSGSSLHNGSCKEMNDDCMSYKNQ